MKALVLILFAIPKFMFSFKDSRLSLNSLDRMLSTGIRVELGGRHHHRYEDYMQQEEVQLEEAFRESLRFQWDVLMSSDVDNRAPFVVCSPRQRSYISRIETVIDKARLKLFYNAGTEACLLAHGTLDEVNALEQLDGVGVDPLPHGAKISPAVFGGYHPAPGQRRSLADVHSLLKGSADNLHIPNGLDISLAPGVSGVGLLLQWKEELERHGRSLWDDHLSERFLWLQSEEDATLGASSSLLWQTIAATHSSDGCNFAALRPYGRGEEADWAGAHSTNRGAFAGMDELGSTAGAQTRCLLSLLAFLSTRDTVTYIDELPQVQSTDVVASWITQSDVEESYPLWDAGLRGETEIIAMADSGADITSCYFSEDLVADNIACSTYSKPITDLTKRKIVQYVGYTNCNDSQGGHGTHVAGSLIGGMTNAVSGQHLGDGSAFGAKLAVFDFGDDTGALYTPSNLASSLFSPAYDAGARVSSNSWGAMRNTYTTLDSQMDDYVYLNTDLTVVVAAGNCGDPSGGCYTSSNVPLYGNGSILSPALGKNVIAVGASESTRNTAGLADNPNEVAYFSSQGPLFDDGRIKPDVLAPGYHTFSAQANPSDPGSCKVAAMAGTSMATPVVAGAAALIRQYFVQGWYPSGALNPSDAFNPSGVLIKAVLVNSAVSMTAYDGISTGKVQLGVGPDGYQGWGRIHLDTAVDILGNGNLFVVNLQSITQGVVSTYAFTNSAASSGEFRVTLVWIEKGAAAGSKHPVVNNIDLLVKGTSSSPGGAITLFYPNGRTSRDTTNNVQRVVVSSMSSYSLFTITVTGTSVLSSDLPLFSLVVTGAVPITSTSSATTDTTNPDYVARAEFKVQGTPPAEAVTSNYGVAFASVLASKLGAAVSASDIYLARVVGVDGEPSSTMATFDIVVANKSVGDSTISYLLSVSTIADSASALVSSLNNALLGYTVDGCICVATGDSLTSYDCTNCVDGASYSAITSVILSDGSYDLLLSSDLPSTPGATIAEDRKIKVAVLNNLVRTPNLGYVIAVVGIILAITALFGGYVYYSSRKKPEGRWVGLENTLTPTGTGG